MDVFGIDYMSYNRILTFGEFIRELREAAGLPIWKVAAKLDIDPSLLGKIERNCRHPKRELICRIAEIFDQKEDYLLSVFLSDQIALKVIKENGDPKVLKVAEKKIKHFISKENA